MNYSWGFHVAIPDLVALDFEKILKKELPSMDVFKILRIEGDIVWVDMRACNAKTTEEAYRYLEKFVSLLFSPALKKLFIHQKKIADKNLLS